MKKIISMFLLLIALCLFTACNPSSTIYYLMDSWPIPYYMHSNYTNFFLNQYPNISEDDFVAAILMGKEKEATNNIGCTPSFLSPDEIFELGIISKEDSKTLKKFQAPDHHPNSSKFFGVMYAFIDDELKVVCCSQYYGRDVFIFDCLNDFGLLEKMAELSEMCGYDVKEFLREKSKAQLDEIIEKRSKYTVNHNPDHSKYVSASSYYPIFINEGRNEDEYLRRYMFAEKIPSFLPRESEENYDLLRIDEAKCLEKECAVYTVYEMKEVE